MSRRTIKKGNMKIIIYGDTRIIGASYDTVICDIHVSRNTGEMREYFDTYKYSATTTRHQGYLADIFVRVITAKDPRTEIAKISADDLHYMSVAERKHWNLV